MAGRNAKMGMSFIVLGLILEMLMIMDGMFSFTCLFMGIVVMLVGLGLYLSSKDSKD